MDIKQDFIKIKFGFKLNEKNLLRWDKLNAVQKEYIENNEIFFLEIIAEYHSLAKKHHDLIMNLLEIEESNELQPFYEKVFAFKSNNPKYHTQIPCKLSQFRGAFCL